VRLLGRVVRELPGRLAVEAGVRPTGWFVNHPYDPEGSGPLAGVGDPGIEIPGWGCRAAPAKSACADWGDARAR
jgi:hypothetical protein